MHQNSLDIMKSFVEKYLPDEELKILDLGSRVVARQAQLGSYRQFFANKKWRYTGADIEAGDNVDVILTDGYKFPFGDGEFDMVISGQTMEHMEYPWIWIKELARVLKKGGLCCLVAPSVCHEHRYPIDTYRFYPDGLRALAKWSGLEVMEVKKRENDTYLIAKNPVKNLK
jgi:SAM-dependent methyltransferase